MTKRGQAALEFLMTYGWALLVVLVAMGALSFFGVTSPDSFLPDKCILGLGFVCSGAIFNTVSTAIQGIGFVRFDVTNSLGKDISEFYIVIDPDNQQCGGWTGFVTTPAIPFNNNFKNGVTYPILTKFPGVGGGTSINGLYCGCKAPLLSTNCGVATEVDNCCTPLDLVTHPNDLCPTYSGGKTCKLPSGSYLDMTSTKKLQSKIWIFYREKGSTILHKRIGEISLKNEGAVNLA